ncbi:serine:threonine protein kinase 17A [Echinococcus multilocularis]|uniref:Serine:threonine protein kinase 17A n=1 Tax=Echinococcus multilocularis TaxID=6211 RepID=A0A068Y4I1_ECHMU|nr:serine:threonine protein kinase 17A [Echinococcus multilocularis]
MPSQGACRGSSSCPKRFNSDMALNESWRQFYDTDGDAIGRGGAGKVFRIRLRCAGILHERKSSMPACLPTGEFRPSFELVNDIPDGKSLAIKIIRRFRCGRDSIEKIRNEIELIRTLQPSNKDYNAPSAVAPLLFSVHEDPTQVAIVMEFAEGGSLFDLCSPKTLNRPLLPSGDGDFSDGTTPQSRIPESYVASVLSRITNALAFMHEKANIVHLDIKAENILLRKPYPSTDVFITDFGLASVLNKSKPHKELAGTPDYAAPEVISYDPVSFATDMWSVGVLAYFLLTGVSPFLAESKALTLSNITQMKIDYPSHLFEVVSPLALDFIRSLIKRNPKARLSASQCCQHEWLLQQTQQKQAKVEVLAEDAGAGGSGDESTSSTSSSSSTASPTRKRLALEDTVVGSQENVETGRSSEALTALAVVGGCRKALTSRMPFNLEGLPRHHSPGSVSNSYRHHHYHHQPRRRSVLASISPSTTVTEVSPID